MAKKGTKPRKPRRRKPRSGEVVNWDKPNWDPLLGLARVYVDEFMWAYEAELENGVRVHAFKHYWTRRYLFLDEQGKAWLYREDGRYEPLVHDLVEHFNQVVLWRCAGKHQEEAEEWLEEHERRLEEGGTDEWLSGDLDPGRPEYDL